MRTVLSVLVLLASGPAALAEGPLPLGEPHLKLIERTPEELTRIKGVIGGNTFELSPYEGRPAGAATAMEPLASAPFSNPTNGLTDDRALEFRLGEALFEKLWVQAPSSTISSDGLGPLYNARACSACHVNDGRGHPPSGDEPSLGLVLRLSQIDAQGLIRPDPHYGFQLQDRAITGHAAEATLDVTYSNRAVELGDGSQIELRVPTYRLVDAAYGVKDTQTLTSPRVAPQMIGLGLLEAIPEEDILANADPTDTNGDGISGRPNKVWSREFDQWMLGRFGHKAGNPTVKQQSADAANGDIGLSSTLFPTAFGDCTELQTDCRGERHGDTPSQNDRELGDTALDLMAFYAANLAVPAREHAADPDVLRGKALFHEAGCAACHQPSFVTHRLEDEPERSFQLIWPYSDMLLHDMGEGLADHRPEWQANGREWRTAPLWGIGRTQQVSGQTTFLHDGRARSLLEAILWHGGEAEGARENIRQMDAADRGAIITFLESL